MTDLAPDAVLAPSTIADAERPEVALAYATALIDPWLVEQIRRIEDANGEHGMLGRFIRRLEVELASFRATFSGLVERGETAKAVRAAHTVKGMCLQIGARALGLLFADIERCAKSGDYCEAQRRFDAGTSLIARSLDALKQA